MLHFLLCRESVLGMPRIEIEFEFDMVFCFGIRLAPYAVFSTRIHHQHIAGPVESDRPPNTKAFYFLKLAEKARVFMYPCTCTLVSVYYVILQTSSNTHLYLSRRSTRLTVHIAF